jgi:hypothetical protein
VPRQHEGDEDRDRHHGRAHADGEVHGALLSMSCK